jgi:hypothetical protein
MAAFPAGIVPELTGHRERFADPKPNGLVFIGPEGGRLRCSNREALAFGKAVYDVRTALGLTVAALAERAAMSDDEVECIEEGGPEPAIALLRRLAAACKAEVRLTAGHDLGSVSFETRAA